MWKMVGLGFCVLLWSGVATAGVLDKPAFTATPEELLAEAARLAPGDAPVTYLRDDVTIAFDDAGRAERRYRMVIVIHAPSAVDDWGTLTLDWRPFYQERPVLRARVIGPTGQVAELDPTLVSDAPAVSESPSVFSDRRDMEAPLPRLSVGAVIEEELVIQDREPLLPAGVTDAVGFQRSVPVERQVVTISAPSARKLHLITRGFARPPAPKRTTANGRVTWIYDVGRQAADDGYDVGLPPDLVDDPQLRLGTAASWAAVAADYQRLVDARLRDPVALPAGLAPGTDRATVDRIVAWLHAHVRYTGIELSDSAIIPWPPAETLKRGFGDCKDKASLLIALLRAAGISADLVLLSTGPGLDVFRETPGMGDFDHAIVRARVGGKDVWIDATEEMLPAGQLPSRDQGRRALVIAPGTRDLIMTPAAAAADNVVREVRTYHLSETLYATVAEVSHERGVYADNLRSWIRDRARADVHKDLTGYVERAYRGKLTKFTSTDPRDVGTPFALTVEADTVRRATADRDQIDVWLFPSDTLARLPSIFTDASTEVDDDLKARTTDYAWYVPHVYEIEHRLIVPAGHRAPALAAPERRALGTMTLTTTRRLDGAAVVVTYRLDTGKPRLTAAELRATRAAVRELQKADGEHVVIAELGATLREQGKLVEAIAEYQRMIALHPTEAVHHQQLALAYQAAGMGAAARRAARKATEVEPTSGDAHAVLAHVLRRDDFGRQDGRPADRPAVIAAYREALRRSPEHLGALVDLAGVLALDDRGRIGDDPAALREAATLWRRAKDVAGDGDYDVRLATALLRAGQYAEAEALVATMSASEDRAAVQLAAVAALRGLDAARALFPSLGGGAGRDRALTTAFGYLLLQRNYDLARGMYTELRRGQVSTTEDLQVAAVTRVDPAKLELADPQTAARLMMEAMTGGTPRAAPWSAEVAADLQRIARAIQEEGDAAASLPPALARDLMYANVTMTVSGNAADGWQVRIQTGSKTMRVYVVKRGKRAEVIGGAALPSGMASAIRAAVAKDDLAAASRWVDRLAADVAGSTDPWAEALIELHRIERARAGTGPLPKAALELAAGFLATAGTQSAAAVPSLRRCVAERDDLDPPCQRLLAYALAEGDAWVGAAEAWAGFATEKPNDPARALMHADLLARAGKAPAAYAIIDRLLAAQPDDLAAIRGRVQATLAAGSWAEAAPWFDRLVAHADANAGDLNNAAWTHLLHGTAASARDLALRAETRLGNEPVSPSLANTIAAALAESDEPYRAWQYLKQSIPAVGRGEADDADWYVLGRIAETYGLRDDAIAAYRRVKPPAARSFLPHAHDLAKRNLARLGVK